MLHTFSQRAGKAVVERLTLLINHVLAAEPVAMQRLKAHAGRTVRVVLSGWPSMLPASPDLSFLITPAGLLEWTGDEPPAAITPVPDLILSVDMSNPAMALLQVADGQRPRVDVAGDSGLATDVSWLMDNLRWDIEDDLSGMVGPAVARQLARLGSLLASGVHRAVNSLSDVVDRVAPRAGTAPPPAGSAPR